MYFNGVAVKKDQRHALELYERMCKGGNTAGCADLGVALRDADAPLRDHRRAVKLFTQACDAGVAGGCYFLGDMYRTGRGVGKDAKRAAGLFKQACDGRWQRARRDLGELYQSGTGVKADIITALVLFTQACDLGDGPSCTTVGRALATGSRDVRKDEAGAKEFLQKGCARGDQRACEPSKPSP